MPPPNIHACNGLRPPWGTGALQRTALSLTPAAPALTPHTPGPPQVSFDKGDDKKKRHKSEKKLKGRAAKEANGGKKPLKRKKAA